MDEELDEEELEALEMTLEDVMAMWEAGTPVKLARREPRRIRKRRKKREREAEKQAPNPKPSV